MSRLRSNFLQGTLAGSILSGATTITSSAFASLPVVASPDTLTITLDPDGVGGNPEIVSVTAHSSSSTTITVTRGAEGTTARGHALGVTWVHAPTAADYNGGLRPEMFAAVGDGSTDDTSALQAMLDAAAGCVVKFTAGKTWKTTSQLTVSDDDVTLEFEAGATIDATGIGVGDNAIAAVGSVGVSTTLTADATPSAAADQVLAVVSSSGFAAGDMVFVTSDAEVFNSERPLQFVKGEAGFVKTVGSGTITLTAALEDSYSTSGYTVTVKKINPVRRFHLSGGRIICPGAGGQNYAVYNQFFQDAVVEGVTVEDSERTGIYFERGVGFRAAFNTVVRSNETGLGYGILGQGAVDGAFVGNTLRECRHGLDISNGVTMPVSRHLVMTGNNVRDCTSAGISTHGGAEHVVITGNTVVNCGGGIVSRCPGATITSNTILGTKSLAASADSYQHGIWIGDFDHGTSPAATDLVIAGNTVDLTGSSGAGIVGIAVTPPTLRASIRGNVVRGQDSYGILAQGKTHAELDIVGNMIDGSAQASGREGILVYHHSAASGDYSRNVVVSNNVIANAQGDAIRVDGGYDTSNRSKGIVIAGNAVRSTLGGHCDINLHNGYYGDGCVIYGNVLPTKGSPDNAAASGAIYIDTSLFSPLPLEFGNMRSGSSNFVLSTDRLWMNAQAGTNRDIVWNSGGVERWTLRVDSTSESGGDAGSNLALISRTDAGALKATILTILRASGVLSFADGVNFGFGTTTGTKLGTNSSHKIGVYGATPIVQPSGTPAAATDLASVISLANSLRSSLLALGWIA